MGSQQPVLNGKDRNFQSHGLEEGDSSPRPSTTLVIKCVNSLLKAVCLTRA